MSELELKDSAVARGRQVPPWRVAGSLLSPQGRLRSDEPFGGRHLQLCSAKYLRTGVTGPGGQWLRRYGRGVGACGCPLCSGQMAVGSEP